MKGQISITESIDYIFVEAKGKLPVTVNDLVLQPGQAYSEHSPKVPIVINGEDYIYNLG